MNYDNGWQLQKAVYAALVANTPLISLAKVYDSPAQDVAMPYVDIGEIDILDWGTKNTEGGDHNLTLHVWSNYGGKKECWSIIGQIITTLHEASLVVTGHTLVMIRHSNTRVMRDADGLTFHGVVEFRALTQSV
jgi:hypothetical protein